MCACEAPTHYIMLSSAIDTLPASQWWFHAAMQYSIKPHTFHRQSLLSVFVIFGSANKSDLLSMYSVLAKWYKPDFPACRGS